MKATTATRIHSIAARFSHAAVPVYLDGLVSTMGDPRPGPCFIICAACANLLGDEQVLEARVVEQPGCIEYNYRRPARRVAETLYRCSCGHEQLSRQRLDGVERWESVAREAVMV